MITHENVDIVKCVSTQGAKNNGVHWSTYYVACTKGVNAELIRDFYITLVLETREGRENKIE